jgi:signal transduction histidine kinase
LGLSLVAAICAHHGGALVLRDNAPGLKAELHLPIKS